MKLLLEHLTNLRSVLKINRFFYLIFSFLLFSLEAADDRIFLGIDQIFTPSFQHLLKGKKIGLITNHTGVDSQGSSTIKLFKDRQKQLDYQLVALFAPEHGLKGIQYAGELVPTLFEGVPIFSLHGETRRPTKKMLSGIDTIVYDIQDLGSRSYTYITTLFYIMEEAAKEKIQVVVLDRPNPLGGLLVDGPMLEESMRSFLGYINVPYCHGMTVGELALYFNKEYHIECDLLVVPMKGWNRKMSFRDTGLDWTPTSPQVPEAETAFFYPTTGILGELQIVNIGIGYSLPFKLIGAPWIDAETFALKLNEQKFPGVRFQPFHYRPFFGRFAGETCHGVLIVITDPAQYLPVTTQYLLIGVLKALYPKEFQEGLSKASERFHMFNKVNGTEQILQIIQQHQYIIWRLRSFHKEERSHYLAKRKPYLLYPPS